MIVPNIDRVIIKPIPIKELTNSGLIIAGQLKPGETLLFGEIVHPGDTRFKAGQKVFYSEYSSAGILDAQAMLDGEKSFGELSREGLVVVAQDDLMAYYD